MPPTDPNSKRPPSDPLEPSLPTIDLENEGAVDLGDFQVDDDEVPLAALPEPPSGQSLTSWTEVIRRQRAALTQPPGDGSDPVRVDAPSDKDLLTRLDAGEHPGSPAAAGARRPGDTSEIPQADLPLFTPPTGASESDIDFGRGTVGGGTGESEVKFDILYPPSDAGGIMPSVSLSGVDFQAATPVPPSSDIPYAKAIDPSTSGLNLGADTGPPGEGGRSSILDDLLKDAGGDPAASADLLDFGDEPVRTMKPTHPAGERPAVPTRPSIDMAGGAPEDDELDLLDDGRGSEDAIDLYAEPAAAPSITDSGTLEISAEAREAAQRRADLQESSSVDLSSRPSFPGSEFDVAIEASDNPSESDIDLNLPPIDDEGNSSMFHRRALDTNSAALAAEFESRRRDRTEDEDEEKPARKRREVRPARSEAAPVKTGGYLIHGGIIGLLLGAGGVLAAYFGGALPNRQPESTPVVADNSAEVARLKQDADAARKEATAAKSDAESVKKSLADAGIDPAKVGESFKQLADAKTASDEQAATFKAASQDAQKQLIAARTAEEAAKKELAAATKSVDTAKAEAVAATKAADEALAGLTKAFKDVGIDAAKPDEAIKKLVEARTAAETKEKDAATKLAETMKKITDLTVQADTAKKSYDDARKAAEDLTRARDASDATVKAIGDRLAKARFVGDKADAPAILKGIDEALKAGSTDATKSLRDELTKVREQEAKAKVELAAARDKEAEATRTAAAAKAEAQKLAADMAKVKTETDKLGRDAADAIARATAAEKAASEARVAAERSSAELARLKTENDRLARDLDAVKELAALIKAPAATAAGPAVKPDPARLAEQFFGDGLRAFHNSRHTDAESAFRKAVQFRPADARYHYFLGLALWMRKDAAGAEAEFEKGRDLELAGRPSSRVIGAALERIQGPARQAVDAYRP